MARWVGKRVLEVNRPGLEMCKNGMMVYLNSFGHFKAKWNNSGPWNCCRCHYHHHSGRLPPAPALPPPTHTPGAPKTRSSHTPQIDVTYNVPDPVAKPSFQLFVNLQEPEADRPWHPAPASSANDDDPAADLHHQEYPVTLEVCTR